jgi:hypothetical protein
VIMDEVNWCQLSIVGLGMAAAHGLYETAAAICVVP